MSRFADSTTEDVYNGLPRKSARRRIPERLWPSARIKLDRVLAAQSLEDLACSRTNALEPIRGDWTGDWSFRIDRRKYRVTFIWTSEGARNVWVGSYG